MSYRLRRPGNKEYVTKFLAGEPTARLELVISMVSIIWCLLLSNYGTQRRFLLLTSLLAILDQVRDEWHFIIDPDVRLLLHIATQNDIITSFPNSSLIMLTWPFNYWIPLPSG